MAWTMECAMNLFYIAVPLAAFVLFAVTLGYASVVAPGVAKK